LLKAELWTAFMDLSMAAMTEDVCSERARAHAQEGLRRTAPKSE
jgi:hypothetical protein